MSVCLFVCPRSHAIFFAWTGAERLSSVDWCGASLALAWSPKNGEVFRIGRMGLSSGALKTGMCSGSPREKKMLTAPFLTTAERKKKNGDTIRIGWEIRCLPYAGFFCIHPNALTLAEVLISTLRWPGAGPNWEALSCLEHISLGGISRRKNVSKRNLQKCKFWR